MVRLNKKNIEEKEITIKVRTACPRNLVAFSLYTQYVKINKTPWTYSIVCYQINICLFGSICIFSYIDTNPILKLIGIWIQLCYRIGSGSVL